MTNLFAWLGGYNSRTLTDARPEEMARIAKLGGAVLFAAFWAGTSWGFAGWIYSTDMAFYPHLAITALAASLGLALVMVFDRNVLYFTDTLGKAGKLRLIASFLFRGTIALVVGFMSAQTMIPWLFKDELKVQALQMSEVADRARVERLNDQFRLGIKEAAVKAAEEDVARFEKAVAQLPLSIQQQFSVATRCWGEYKAQQTALLRSKEGYSTIEVRAKLAGKAAICDRDKKVALAQRDAYLTRVQGQLEQAREHKLAKETALSEADSAVKNKVEHAARIESEGFSIRSSIVLWGLLSTNHGALLKWLVISLVMLMIELCPFLVKGLAGQSNVGRRIAVQREIENRRLAEQLQQQEHDFVISSVVNDASTRAVREAMNNPNVRASFLQSFTQQMAALAPTEAVRAMLRDLEARHVDVEDFINRFPRYATIIGQAWAKAVKQTAEILAQGLNGKVPGQRAGEERDEGVTPKPTPGYAEERPVVLQ